MAEALRRKLVELDLLDRGKKVVRDGDFVVFPIAVEDSSAVKQLCEEFKCEVVRAEFPEVKPPSLTLHDVLSEKLPPHLLASLPRAYDVIGDIAIIELPEELLPYKELVGEALMKVNSHVKAVFAKAGKVNGAYRVRKLLHLAGENRTVTRHKEYGCIFSVDVASTYFSPRLSWEHKRIASLVKPGETVVDMFAGVGPFAIMITREVDATVYAIDLNPEAIKHLKINLQLNKLRGKVIPILGDAKEVIIKELKGIADRVIMNLPHSSHLFLDAACAALKEEGGIIHFYTVARDPSPLEQAENLFSSSIPAGSRHIKRILHRRVVKAVAPREWLVVVDAEVT